MQTEDSQKGTSLLELLAVMFIIGLLTSMACDLMINTMRRAALRTAAINLSQLMERVRFDSEGNSCMRGLRFSRIASGWQYAVYEDADGDGVLNADILAGVDILVDGPFPLTDRTSIASIGVPGPQVEHPDSGSEFPQSMAPVNFNQSSICSFSPDGDATPGTIYLVNGTRGEAAMVRSSGKGGRIRTLFFGLGGSGWHP